MSSFLDRWMYRDSSHSHNMGLKNGNTGSTYTKTGSLPTHEHSVIQTYTDANGEIIEKTTPNLKNVPWSYYAEMKKTSRRGSDVSDAGDAASVEE